ncbi:alpha/beta fold hydrolase [uncultured Amphritea sp.]|uniref:alpha/beta fold hydrolase n=1 Tax=uncultured Amphritea sp. TaxID=981605 RepID=UPI002631455D|nr:alpha/beta fold hydrolase [uncultured Amphritea sp.]
MLYSQQQGNPQGQPLVLLHGWGMHSGVWYTLLPELQQDFHIILIDLPGLGRSAASLPGCYDLASVTRLLAEVAPASAVWLGWSLGGIIAMEFAQRYPERVSGLITLGTSPCFVERPDWCFGMDEATYSQFEDDLAANPAKTLQRFNMLQVQGSSTARADLKSLKQILSEVAPTPPALVDSLALLRDDYRSIYNATEHPSLHLLCDQDMLAPAAMAGALSLLQPKADVNVLAGQSHVGFLSAPQCLAERIRTFCL